MICVQTQGERSLYAHFGGGDLLFRAAVLRVEPAPTSIAPLLVFELLNPAARWEGLSRLYDFAAARRLAENVAQKAEANDRIKILRKDALGQRVNCSQLFHRLLVFRDSMGSNRQPQHCSYMGSLRRKRPFNSRQRMYLCAVKQRYWAIFLLDQQADRFHCFLPGSIHRLRRLHRWVR